MASARPSRKWKMEAKKRKGTKSVQASSSRRIVCCRGKHRAVAAISGYMYSSMGSAVARGKSAMGKGREREGEQEGPRAGGRRGGDQERRRARFKLSRSERRKLNSPSRGFEHELSSRDLPRGVRNAPSSLGEFFRPLTPSPSPSLPLPPAHCVGVAVVRGVLLVLAVWPHVVLPHSPGLPRAVHPRLAPAPALALAALHLPLQARRPARTPPELSSLFLATSYLHALSEIVLRGANVGPTESTRQGGARN